MHLTFAELKEKLSKLTPKELAKPAALFDDHEGILIGICDLCPTSDWGSSMPENQFAIEASDDDIEF